MVEGKTKPGRCCSGLDKTQTVHATNV